MHNNTPFQRTKLALLITTIAAPAAALAAPMDLVQYPPGSAYKTPIPNVILSIDTSGSMNTTDSGTTKSRLAFVREGLENTLIKKPDGTPITKYDNKFRLAWQSYTCNNIPSSTGNCNSDNAIAKFDGTHKTTFATWVKNLVSGTASGTTNTPSHMLVWNAGEYLKTTGANSPWNATPGTSDSAPLDCRKAYHIFLTDGGWNYSTPTKWYPAYTPDKPGAATAFSFNTKILATDPYAQEIQNADGKLKSLPDAVSYNPSTNGQLKVYSDSYTRNIKNSANNKDYVYPSLADMAFHYWATDLQSSIPDKLSKRITQSGSQTFTSGTLTNSIDEYWNPKNNPATWQHLVQYTVGYGKNAATLPKKTTTSPQFTGGMYGSGLTDLVVGKTTWDNVVDSTADGDYDGYRPQDMWHMAINSRGKFYPVSGGDLTSVFSDIFDDLIVDTSAPISGFTSASGSVSRTNTESYQTTYVAAENKNSNDNTWFGFVTSDTLSTTGDATPNADWGVVAGKNKTTADKLSEITDISTRLILSYDLLGSSTDKGISFKWANFTETPDPASTASAKMWLNNGTVGTAASILGDTRGEDRLNFIRGDRSKEALNDTSAASIKFRNRKHIQGDIVNSTVWYVGEPASGYPIASYKSFSNTYRTRLPMVYVGGNDGMLHGFSAKDGTEKIAYVPHGVIQNLAQLTDANYNHRYYVDGSPMSGDVNLGAVGSPDWRTFLVGTLGAGGRGYFVLDVTKSGPKDASSPVPNDFVEGSASALVVMDKTAAAAVDAVPPAKPADPNAHPDIGHILGEPTVSESNQQRVLQITQMNDGRWAFISGNGYNSINENPVLLIQYLDGDKSLKTIQPSDPACPAAMKPKGNGLSTPQLLDVNGDSIPDMVYAGDLCGNVWKFDISSTTASNWSVAFSGSPLFTAQYTNAATGSSSRQAITTAPVLRPNRKAGGLMVAFGTGRNLTEGDRTDKSVQTVYSVLDNTRYTVESTGADKGRIKVKSSDPTPSPVSNGRSDLLSQSVTSGTAAGATGAGASLGREFWKLTTEEVTYACDAGDTVCEAKIKKGWYLDLPVSGERVTKSISFYDGSNILEIMSEVPASGSATASGDEVCAPQPSVAKPYRTLINISSGTPAKPPILDVNGDGAFKAADDGGYARMTASGKELRFATKDLQLRKGSDGKVDKLAKLPELLLRPSWRQLK